MLLTVTIMFMPVYALYYIILHHIISFNSHKNSNIATKITMINNDHNSDTLNCESYKPLSITFLRFTLPNTL